MVLRVHTNDVMTINIRRVLCNCSLSGCVANKRASLLSATRMFCRLYARANFRAKVAAMLPWEDDDYEAPTDLCTERQLQSPATYDAVDLYAKRGGRAVTIVSRFLDGQKNQSIRNTSSVNYSAAAIKSCCSNLMAIAG